METISRKQLLKWLEDNKELVQLMIWQDRAEELSELLKECKHKRPPKKCKCCPVYGEACIGDTCEVG